MEKVIVPELIRKTEKFDYNGVVIEVIPYISVVDEISLISDYVERYFRPNYPDTTFSYMQKGNFDFWQAEYALIQRIVRDMTNVDVDVDKTKADEVMEIFYLAVKKIDNYYQFRDRLDETIQAIKDSKSIGVVIDDLIDKINNIVESFSNIDPEKMKELADSIIQKIDSSDVAPIFKEAAQAAESTKQIKTRKAKESKA